jgi:predicted DNA-binding transcriptional regulator AlpA
MTDRYLSKNDLATLYGVSTRTIDNWTKDGRLPAPERLPSNRPRWLESVARQALKSVATDGEHGTASA